MRFCRASYHFFRNGLYILSVNEKLPVFEFRYFGKNMATFIVHVSGQRQTV